MVNRRSVASPLAKVTVAVGSQAVGHSTSDEPAERPQAGQPGECLRVSLCVNQRGQRVGGGKLISITFGSLNRQRENGRVIELLDTGRPLGEFAGQQRADRLCVSSFR